MCPQLSHWYHSPLSPLIINLNSLPSTQYGHLVLSVGQRAGVEDIGFDAARVAGAARASNLSNLALVSTIRAAIPTGIPAITRICTRRWNTPHNTRSNVVGNGTGNGTKGPLVMWRHRMARFSPLPA